MIPAQPLNRLAAITLAVLLSGCAAVQVAERPETLAGCAIFAILMGADGWTTWQIFRFGGFERNTWIAKLISTVGLDWALAFVKVGCIAAVGFAVYLGQMPAWLLAVLDAGYAVQVYWNYQQLQKHKGN